jgi:F-type H+-transporting ATPase subunit alpha
VSIFAGTGGLLDDVAVGDVRRFEAELLEWFRTRHTDLLDQIRSTGTLPDEAKMRGAVEAFKDQFQASEPAAAS